MPIPNCISGKDVYILATDTLNSPPKPGPQSRALCGTVCALLIVIVLY